MSAVRRGDGTTGYAVVDVVRMRLEPEARDAEIDATIVADGVDTLQVFEEGDDGDKTVTAYARKRHPHHVIMGVKPRRDKIVRSTNAWADLGRGKIFLVKGRWNHPFIDELVRFPNGKHDDQMDGFSGAYNELLLHSLSVTIR